MNGRCCSQTHDSRLSQTWDALSNVLTTTDSLGNVTTYEYDNLSRLTKRTTPTPMGRVR